MTANPALTIAYLGDEEERPLAVAVARQIANSVSAALGREWSLTLSFAAPGDPIPPGAVGLLSLMSEVHSEKDFSDLAFEWHYRLAGRVAAGERHIVLPTLFRHAAEGTPVNGIERIRRLNLLAVELSSAHGIEIADVDQACALIGARTLAADHRCASPAAGQVMAHVVAATILGMDLVPALSVEVQQAALALHGTLQQRLQAQRRTATP